MDWRTGNDAFNDRTKVGDNVARIAGRKPGNDASPWFRLGAPVAFLLLWSGGFAFAALGLAHAGPMTFLAMRYALVLAVLVPLVLVMRPPLPDGATAVGVAAGTMALIVSLQPVLVALLAPRFAGERVGGARWAGLGVGLLGAALVIVSRSSVEAPPL